MTFDQALYDAVMEAIPKDSVYDHRYRTGYEDAATTVARLAAERVPVIPEGWKVVHAQCGLMRVADQRDVYASRGTWLEALTAAISEAAKERDHE